LCINHDFCTEPVNVRCWVISGKQMLALSFSGFDTLADLLPWTNGAVSPTLREIVPSTLTAALLR
jgi:hypothetical protein